jgi:hypothetical protein
LITLSWTSSFTPKMCCSTSLGEFILARTHLIASRFSSCQTCLTCLHWKKQVTSIFIQHSTHYASCIKIHPPPFQAHP